MEEKTIHRLKQFVIDRDWNQFHSPGNLAKSICIESSELLEIFQWNDQSSDLKCIKDELADVLIYCMLLASKYNLDIDRIINEKISKNERNYPVEKSKGSSKKHNKQ